MKIRKTKTNIFLLFVVGLLIGVVCALRNPAPTASVEQTVQSTEVAQ